jgi:hypothetical protein
VTGLPSHWADCINVGLIQVWFPGSCRCSGLVGSKLVGKACNMTGNWLGKVTRSEQSRVVHQFLFFSSQRA